MKKLTCFLLVLCLLCSFASVLGVEPAEPVLDVEATEIAPTEHKKAVCAVASSSAALAEGDGDTAEEVQFEGGDGSPEDPYQIATADQLIAFAELVNAGNSSLCAQLVDNIVINEDPAASIREGKADELLIVPPIGTDNVSYSGKFEGNGCTITGLYCDVNLYNADSETAYYYALFGKLGGGMIFNVNLDKVYLSATADSSSIILASLVATGGGDIIDCSVNGQIFASSAKGDIIVGGILGQGEFLYPSNCQAFCNLTLKTTEGSVIAGGIAACYAPVEGCRNYGDISVSSLGETVPETDCDIVVGGTIGYTNSASAGYNLGNISVNIDKANYSAMVGGIVGYTDFINGTKGYNLGNISVTTGNVLVGGCCAYSENNIYDSYNRGSISATCTATDGTALAGGIVGIGNYVLSNNYNYGDVTANGKSDSTIGAAGIAGICGNSITESYNLGLITAFGNNNAVADAITVGTNAEDQIVTCEELYSLKWIAPVSDFCTELTQAEFKTLWTDETHPEWDYAPVFDDVLYQETPFSDTNPLSWYYDATVYAYTNDLMQGMSMTKFEPNLAMTRAMLVTVLYRMAGSPDVSAMENPFPDIPADTWYTDAVIWAANNNIVKGYQEDGNFHPTWDITREQIASILYRYVTEYLGETAGVFGDLSTFPDSDSVSEYARESIAWATGEGLITGTREGDQVLLDPRGLATRAQIATILMRFCQNDAE